ncbi:M28 family peptidase [Rhodohalobacter sp. 8-1]|uniref:M28 family peptidase n=1 Tax=Rhodohalobacter sp. 8-1 TaxID=3131972 RepID=UPI0030EBBA7E
MSSDYQKLQEYVKELSEKLVPRDAAHPENLKKVADYIEERLKSFTDRVENQPYSADGMTVRNVRAFFGPETDDRIVVGAHYDVAGPYPGADDNASGVAGLLELARLLSDEELPIQVELVSYPLEEPPYFYTKKMGSYIHAKSLKDEAVNVKAMIALEMIGYFSDDEGSQSYPLSLLRPFYPSVGNYIAVVGKMFQKGLVRKVKKAMKGVASLPVESINAPKLVPGIAFSDHLNYWRHGFPAVMITDTAMYRNPNYHSPTDTAGTLNYRKMAQVVDGVKESVQKLAKGE